MSDSNSELVARLAHRPEEAPEPVRLPVTGEWNAPIDMVHADSKTVTEIIKGEVAALKAKAARWEPRPWPG